MKKKRIFEENSGTIGGYMSLQTSATASEYTLEWKKYQPYFWR